MIISKTKPNLIVTDRGMEFYNIVFQGFLNNNNIKHCSGNTSLRAVFVETFNLTKRNLLKPLVFEKGDGKWIDILPTKTKKYSNRIHSSTKLTSIQAS